MQKLLDFWPKFYILKDLFSTSIKFKKCSSFQPMKGQRWICRIGTATVKKWTLKWSVVFFYFRPLSNDRKNEMCSLLIGATFKVMSTGFWTRKPEVSFKLAKNAPKFIIVRICSRLYFEFEYFSFEIWILRI